MKYEWEAIEEYFINHVEQRVSLKDISKIFRIPYQTVRRYAAKHKWHSKRFKAWISQQ